MANVAQLVNNLHSLFLADGDKFVATPNFYVFEMYRPHQGAKAVRLDVQAGRLVPTPAEQRDLPRGRLGLARGLKSHRHAGSLARERSGGRFAPLGRRHRGQRPANGAHAREIERTQYVRQAGRTGSQIVRDQLDWLELHLPTGPCLDHSVGYPPGVKTADGASANDHE